MNLRNKSKINCQINLKAGQSEKDFANASAATPPAVYFAKSFSDCPAIAELVWR